MMSHCAFIIRISNPLLTLKGIVDFLLNRSVTVGSINLHCTSDLEAILLVHCSIEKDKIRHTRNLLEKIKGVKDIEILQAHVSNQIKEQ